MKNILFLSILLLFFNLMSVVAQLNISTSGNWSTATNWDSNPNIGDVNTEDVTMDNGISTTILNTENFAIATMTTGNTNTITIDLGGSLTVGVDPTPNTTIVFSTNNGTIINVDGDLTINGKLDVNNNLTLNVTGTLTVTGDVELNNGGSLTISGDATIGGDFTGNNNTALDVDGSVTVAGDFAVGNGSTATGTGSISVVGGCADSGSGVCTSAVLPINLSYFGARTSEKIIELTWITASEENNDYFTIERSSNGLDYHELARVDGAGNSFEELNYSIKDTNPFQGVSYYRLKQTDYDGTNEIFKVVAVEFYGTTDAIKMMQTLGSGNELLIHNNLDEENIAYIYDMTGRGGMIGSLKVGENYINLNQLNAQSGIYTLRVVNVLGKTLVTQKFVIQ